MEVESVMPGYMFLILYIVALWFYIAQGFKRCHNRGNNGFYQFAPFYFLWMIFADGDPYENDYGTNPKGRDFYANWQPED